ncbi:Regulator of G-protein signaling 22 [Dissostichus eleginoides]|uniref:Regulator of G-protein signaling 22 n=1 Tax=Dissostichus eleginoides TaxID=100907 RepID=A0AAD9FBR6_DISEL|nr:Regulator of G-protein signaling 22 [Dissostichus eleginoides]
MCGVVSAELQNLTAGNFENSLASDEVLAHFFNDFLSLPSFPEALQYDPQTGQFELVDGRLTLSPEGSDLFCTAANHSSSPETPQRRPEPLQWTTATLSVAWTESKESSGSSKKDYLFFFSVIATVNTD